MRHAYVRPRVDPRAMLAVLDRALEAHRGETRSRALSRIERRLERNVASAFLAQGLAFSDGLEAIRGEFPAERGEEVRTDPRWVPIFEQAAEATELDFLRALLPPLANAIAAGAEQTKRDVRDAGVEIVEHARLEGRRPRRLREQEQPELPFPETGSAATAAAPAAAQILGDFGVTNPRAVAFLASHAGELITRVNDTTRHQIGVLVREGLEAGMSYNDVARSIQERFVGFAGRLPGLELPLPFEGIVAPIARSRAHIIAVQEAAFAYSEAQMIQARELVGAGVPMRKRWITAGDARVDDPCLDNAAAGWIPLGDAYPTGSDAPPEHVACRCDQAVEPDFGEGRIGPQRVTLGPPGEL